MNFTFSFFRFSSRPEILRTSFPVYVSCSSSVLILCMPSGVSHIKFVSCIEPLLLTSDCLGMYTLCVSKFVAFAIVIVNTSSSAALSITVTLLKQWSSAYKS